MFGKTALPDRDQLTAAQQQAIDNRFSLVELRKIHAQLVENKSVTNENQGLVVEILRVLAEMVVYGDRKSELLFDYFCEKNMLQLFLEIMWSNQGSCPSNVHVQILQTLSILISSVRNDTSLYYLLSNNHINEVIIFPYDMEADESLVAQYVSFIKTLALRLNDQTVQFFFITDTGAFPILTRSIDLLCQKDPMVRIAAQTAILNVYKVNEHRSRVFALQEEVMMQLFQAIVEIMKEQLESMHTICSNYARETDEATLSRLEQNLNDAFINLEDWLYYIQDLIGLGIDKFNRAFIQYIVDVFVEGVVLTSCLRFRSGSLEFGFFHDDSAGNQIKSVATSADSKSSVGAEQLLSNASLTYLLHMTRVINHSYFHESVLLAILHPLDSGCRGTTLGSVADLDDDECPDISALSLRGNLYRNAYFSILLSDDSRLSLLAAYVLCSLVSAYRDYYKSELMDKLTRQEGEDYFAANDDNKDKAQRVIDAQIVALFEVLHIIPPTVVSDVVENVEMRQLQRLDLLVVRPYLQHIGVKLSENLLVAQLVKVLKVAHLHPLVTIQTISFTLSNVLDAIMQYYLKQRLVLSGGSSLPLPPGSPGAAPPTPPTPVYDFESAIAVLREVREACRSAGQSLLARLSSSFSEVLLIIINEETKRFAGRSWRNAFPRMVSNKLLFLPAVAALTVRLGIDFDMPISPTESMRKEVQVFLLLRALFKMHCQHVLQAVSVGLDDELGNYVNDFLILDDANIIPVHACIVGATYDMKGKKFLDAILPVAASGSSTPTTQSPSSSGYSLTASATSILTFGLVGGSGGSSRRSSFSSPSKGVKSPTSNTTSPVPATTGSSAPPTQVSKLKLLFVQDPNMLMLTMQDKSAGKSVFKVHILAPLLYSDAKVDLHERRRLKIIVRSWRPLSNMQRLDAEGGEGNNADGTESNRNSVKLTPKPMEGFLKAAEK
eukprot:gene30709-37105_t